MKTYALTFDAIRPWVIAAWPMANVMVLAWLLVAQRRHTRRTMSKLERLQTILCARIAAESDRTERPDNLIILRERRP